MWEINRIRLHSIGPDRARYANTLIDLSGAGQPVGRLVRPSPATVLSLVNGGGKGVLLKLVFSVVQPGRRATLGGSGALDDFVSHRDVGHVAIEWMHPESGQLLVTGKVLEPRTAAAGSASPELWYKFRPGRRLTLDTLPITTDGRMWTMAGFKKQLAELGKADAGLHLATTTSPGEWKTALIDANLDPVLFGYQRAMNSDEGEAEAILKGINTSADFIKWLLEAITDPTTDERLAGLFASFAEHVALFGVKRKELDFLNEVTPQLRQFDDDVQRDKENDKDLRAAGALLAGLQGGVTTRLQRERAHHETLLELHALALAEYNTAHARAQATRVLGYELERRGLLMRRERALTAKAAAEARGSQLTTDLTAWAAGVAAVIELGSTERAVADLREAADQAARASEPFRLAYARAAANLSAHYRRLASSATARAEQVEGAKTQAQERAAAARREADQRAAEAARAETQREGQLRQLAETERRVAQARAQGALEGTETPAQGLARVHDRQEALQAAERATTALLTDLDLQHGQQARAVQQRRESAGIAEWAQRDAAGRANVARRNAAELLARDDVRSLVGETVDEEELDRAAPSLRMLVADLIATLDETASNLTRAQHDDQRVLDALGDGGLLPPRDDVVAATNALTKAGVAARPGWAYLEALSPEERKQALANSPHLVDGVVVTDGRADASVSDVVERARLMPRSTVVWSAPDDLLSSGPAPRGVVPTNPAMYDPEAAATERQGLTETVESRGHEIDAVRARLAGSRTSAHLLDQWAAAYTPGALVALFTEESSTRAAAERAASDQETAEVALAKTDEEIAAARAQREKDRSALAEIGKAFILLSGVAQSWADIDRLRAEAEELRASAQTLQTQAEALRTEAERATSAAQDHAVEIGGLTGTATSMLAAAEAVTGVDSTVAADHVDPDMRKDLAALSGAHNASRAAYESVLSDTDVRENLRSAESARARAAATVAEFPSDVRARSLELAADPRAGDASGRSQARQLTASELDHANEAAADQVRVLSDIQAQLSAQPALPEGRASYSPLPADWVPTSVEHAAMLLAQARDRLSGEAREESVGEQARDARQLDVDNHSDLLARFERSAAALAETTAAEPIRGETAYAGTPEDADEDRASLNVDLSRYRTEATHIAARIDVDVENVRATANRHSDVVSKAQILLNSVGKQYLIEASSDLVSDFTQRTASLQVEIEQHAQHRDTLINTLIGDANEALGSLAAASRLSRLPANLGGWSGQNFLKIDFQKPEPAVLRSRVASVADRTASDWDTEPAPGRRAAKRTGTSVLIDAVFAAVSGERGHASAFRVSIFQPDQVLAAERVPLEQMQVFSGGQRLTTGIIVYCTLAALRADRLGRSRQKFSGPLILDNPLGKANARHLIDLQLKVARALGVQLLFPSGLRDIEALDAFPLLISMRNDRDMKVGRQYVTVSDRVVQHMPIDDNSGTGDVTSTRLLFKRPEELELTVAAPASERKTSAEQVGDPPDQTA